MIGMQDYKLSLKIIFSNVAVFELDLKTIQRTINYAVQCYGIAY